MQTMFLHLLRSIKYGFQNFVRNVFLTVSTTIVMVLTLFGLGFFLIVNQLSSNAVDEVENKIDIPIYLAEDVKKDKAKEFQSYVQNLANVKSTKFVSEKEALEDFKTTYKDYPDILDSINILNENPLSVTIVVQAENIRDYDGIVDQIKRSQYAGSVVKEINYEKSSTKRIIDRLTRILDWVQNLQFVVMILLAFLAIAIPYNTIRLTMYSYRNEIEIMRLVGASNMQIKGPFLVEGVLFGVFGTIISATLLFTMVLSLPEGVGDFFSTNISSYVQQNALMIVSAQLAVGILLGAGSSALAINRYLKV